MATLVSGGAQGADSVFERHARAHKHQVVIFSGFTESSEEDRCENDRILRIVNKYLKRKYPMRSPISNSLLLRNVQIARTASIMYAIGYRRSESEIDGGTAWACHAYLETHESPQLYFFDQLSQKWYLVTHRSSWTHIERPPAAGASEEVYAGVGSRQLLTCGSEAIASLY